MATGVEANLTGLVFLRPILAFLVILGVLFMLLVKSKILGEEKVILFFISFVTATVFALSGNVVNLVLNVVPWFGVLLIALFFILVLVGFMGNTKDIVGKGLGWFFVIVIILVFLIAGIKLFSATLGPYLPGAYYGYDADPVILSFTDWLYSPSVIGAVFFVIFGGIAFWVLVKYAK